MVYFLARILKLSISTAMENLAGPQEKVSLKKEVLNIHC